MVTSYSCFPWGRMMDETGVPPFPSDVWPMDYPAGLARLFWVDSALIWRASVTPR